LKSVGANATLAPPTIATQDPRMPERHAALSPRLEVESLACERGDRQLFRDLSFSVRGGEMLQVEGANGCGKTTLLRTLCGLLTPSEGTIRWRGENLHRVRDLFLAELAYVGHAGGIKDDLSPRENLRMEAALGSARPEVTSNTVLERLGLSRQAQLPCRSLSAGQKRRVALGRLLIRRASVWLLDEPFTAIDRGGVEQLAGLMADHVHAGGLVILSTHQPVSFPGVDPRTLRLGQ
jgi:heme exporter protein A